MRGLHSVISAGLAAGALAALPLATPAHAREKILHSFTGGNDGAVPFAGLAADAQGNYYATTAYGGGAGDGTVVRYARGSGESVLYAFSGYPDDGADPASEPYVDAGGDLYGTTSGGGSSADGTVFELMPNGSESVLHNFGGSDGAFPEAGLIADANGNLYGTTYGGGALGAGTVFRLAPGGSESVLHSFGATGDGNSPKSRLVRDAKGNLYGTTVFGGADGYGTVFKLKPDGTESVLYSFRGGSDGANPSAGLVRDRTGNLYGTAAAGGANGHGVVFSVSPAGAQTVLHSFAGGSDGAQPLSQLARDRAGNLYGTTFVGGGANAGTVFRLAPDGTLRILHAFTSGGDGANPQGAVVLGRRGRIVGATQYGGESADGTLFQVGN